MFARCRALPVLVVAALLAGCGVEPAPSATPTPVSTQPAESASPAPATPSPTPSPTPPAEPTVTPAPSPCCSLPPPGPGGFTTPVPPKGSAAWKGIRWQKVAAASPLAHVRSITRWRGGFVATGDVLVSGSSARNKVWVSDDGGRWDLLGTDAFGPRAIVVGVAPTADGIMALTVQAGEHDAESGRPSDLGSWTLVGPWQSWTSTDGRAWTAHPGPAFTVPRDMSGQDESYPTLLAGAGTGLVALTLDSQPLAFTRDGITWETASLDAFPGGPAGWKATDTTAFPPGFVSVGHVAIASSDGRTWASSELPCPAEDLVAGPAGLILVGSEGDPHVPETTWCSSLDGRSWQVLPGYRPLGVSTSDDDGCRGMCPNGILLGDGERMVAYRGHPSQAGWTSFNGRSWRRLAFSGPRPAGWTDASGYPYRTLLTPIGLLFVKAETGAAWLGVPRT